LVKWARTLIRCVMHPTLANAAADLKRRAHKRINKRRRKTCAVPALWLVTDEKRLANPKRAIAALPRGSGVILRHYADPRRAQLAEQLAALCRQRGLVFLLAGDWRLAARVNAAGLHLPDHMSRKGPHPGARLWQRRHTRLLTVAAHGYNGVRRAAQLRASAVFLAPVFATASHPERRPLGATRFASIVNKAPLPVLALGGVSATTINALRGSGCAGVAGVGFATHT
jgi:thiamine-phosphate pyrophosphorylase